MSPEPTPAVPTIPYGASVPDNIDVNAIVTAVKSQGVYGPAEQVPALKAVAADAAGKGHDVKIVVLTGYQPKFTYYRDIALTVQQQTGGTVIVLGPDSLGSAGPEFPRVVQESASQNLTLSDPPGAARQMVDQLTAPQTDWTLLTIVLTLFVLAAAVGARLFSRRRGAHAVAGEAPVTERTEPSSVAESAIAAGTSDDLADAGDRASSDG
jgi:hypothetical protein